MDTQNLIAFLQVAEVESFSVAGEKLHLTQPAISKRIAALENQLDVRLFDRIAKRVSLTEAGKVLLPNAKKIMQDVKESRRQLADLSGCVSGELSLATSHHIGLHRLPAVLKQFSQRHPQVDLQLSFLDSETAHSQVLQGHLDLAVITLSPDPHLSLMSQTVWQDKLQFVVAKSHPLAGKQLSNIKELVEFPAILPELSTYTGKIVAEAFAKSGASLQVKMATSNLETIKMMVSIELGWTVLPETMLNNQLSTLAIPKISLQRQLGFVHHRHRSLGNAAQAFIDMLKREKI